MPIPSLPAEAALSFLKDTKGALAWTTRDLADTLKINRAEAQQALNFLMAQGYVQPARAKGEFLTTPAGETVSGAKAPRFTRESVQQALQALADRIQQNIKNPEAPFRVTDAVAFGDFLIPDRARVQSADVGINLIRRASSSQSPAQSPSKSRSGRHKVDNSTSSPPSSFVANVHSASEAKAERNFLRELRARSAHLNLRPYADWMRQRSHRELVRR